MSSDNFVEEPPPSPMTMRSESRMQEKEDEIEYKPRKQPRPRSAGRKRGPPVIKMDSILGPCRQATRFVNNRRFTFIVPLVMASCGDHLKRGVGNLEIFREPESKSKDSVVARVIILRYWKGIEAEVVVKSNTFDFERGGKYSERDAATLFKQYLEQLQEPLVPPELYIRLQACVSNPAYDENRRIEEYQQIIEEIKQPYLDVLLYAVDVLNTVASRSEGDKNEAISFLGKNLNHAIFGRKTVKGARDAMSLEFLIRHSNMWWQSDRRHLGVDMPRIVVDREPTSKEVLAMISVQGSQLNELPRSVREDGLIDELRNGSWVMSESSEQTASPRSEYDSMPFVVAGSNSPRYDGVDSPPLSPLDSLISSPAGDHALAPSDPPEKGTINSISKEGMLGTSPQTKTTVQEVEPDAQAAAHDPDTNSGCSTLCCVVQ